MHLGKGWLLGREVDVSDTQWRSFRSNIPLAGTAFLLYVAISRTLQALGTRHAWSPPAQMRVRAGLAVIGLFLLHGLNSTKILALGATSYLIGRVASGRRLNVVLTWIYALLVLFGLEYMKLTPHYPIFELFERWRGVYPGWHITFNITLLRLISFNVDRYYAHAVGYSPLQHREACAECAASTEAICERRRVQEGHVEHFTFAAFLAYAFYLPLYLAGPIITFNNFVSQIGRPVRQRVLPVLVYALRWLGVMFLMEMLSHLFPVVAIKDTQAWWGFSALDFIILSYLNLNVVYLKLLLIWRFFRLVALADGIVPAENMERCISNTHSMMSFWRSWHRSFNLWIIRYMYLPLGGRRYSAWNIWPIFTFVAVWHDVKLHLLVWSWLVCLFILPEIVLGIVYRRLQMSEWRHGDVLVAMAAGGNIALMGTANLVGFVLGVDGVRTLYAAMLSRSGGATLLVLLAVLYCVAQIQLEMRATERRLGIVKNY